MIQYKIIYVPYTNEHKSQIGELGACELATFFVKEILDFDTHYCEL